MAETRSEGEERALPAKRKPDLTCPNADDEHPTKTPKTADKINGDCHADGGAETVRAEDNGAAKTEVADASGRSAADLEEEEEDDEEEDVQDYGFDEDDEEDDEEYVDDEDVEEDGERTVDLKGKGVLKDYKGKGKLILDDDDDDNGSDSEDSDDADPSDSDGGMQSGSDNDWSDDPLAEVDLDNILPSRTRQRRAQSGVVIADNRRSTDGGGGGSIA